MTDTEPKATLIVCSRETDPGRLPIPGSETRECHACGSTVLVAPSTLARPELSNPSTVFACIQCANLNGLELRAPTAEQKSELGAAGYDPESWPLSHAHGKILHHVDFSPSDVSLDSFPPLGDTMKKTEIEAAAAMLVFGLKTKDNNWLPIKLSELVQIIRSNSDSEPIASWARNPFLKPNFAGLVAMGFAQPVGDPRDAAIVFTNLGAEALRSYVRKKS